jgi:hypothetical protein
VQLEFGILEIKEVFQGETQLQEVFHHQAVEQALLSMHHIQTILQQDIMVVELEQMADLEAVADTEQLLDQMEI